jgi:hypothetical protein
MYLSSMRISKGVPPPNGGSYARFTGVPPPNDGSYARLAGVVAGDTGVPPPTAGATLDFDIRCKTRGPAAVRLERVNIDGGFLGSVRACVRPCVRACIT